jgi:hypothetical protein
MKKLMFLLAFVLAGCGKSAAPLDPAEAAARGTCMATIESRAINRKSVTYSDNGVHAGKNAKGQIEIDLQFSAKNEIGMASTMLARCVASADGKSLVDISVTEPR